jgi:hypothetical protein
MSYFNGRQKGRVTGTFLAALKRKVMMTEGNKLSRTVS